MLLPGAAGDALMILPLAAELFNPALIRYDLALD
jgi:hypothetical protein